MKLQRTMPPVCSQDPNSEPGERAAPEAAAQTTQRVVMEAAAADVLGTDGAFMDDQDTAPGATHQGRVRRKAQQWLTKFAKRHGSLHNQPLPPVLGRRTAPQKPSHALEFELPQASGPSLLYRAVASAAACAARSTSGAPAQHLDAGLIAQLLRRDTPKTETFAELSDAPVERALDSILADEVICRMPPHLLQPIADLARASADVFDQVEPQRRLVWLTALCEVLKQEFPRPWGSKAPITALLCGEENTAQVKADALSTFLRQRPKDGFEAMAAIAMLRALYQGAERKGFALTTVPFSPRANNYYATDMLALTGRIYIQWGTEKPKHQGVGLTAYGAPSPIDASWMVPATLPCHLYRPNPSCSAVVKDLAYGNPYGVGISGSTNLFLFAAGHFNALGATQIDLMALATAMAAILCYDGGHSANEAYQAAKMYPEAASTSLAQLQAYHPGFARDLFISQVDPEKSWLAEAAFARLADFLLRTYAQQPEMNLPNVGDAYPAQEQSIEDRDFVSKKEMASKSASIFTNSALFQQGRLRVRAQQWLSKPRPASDAPLGQAPALTRDAARIYKLHGAAVFTLPEPTGPTLLEQATASARACAIGRLAGGPSFGAAQSLDVELVSQLLCRNTPKTETSEQLSDAPVERALDSILADEAISRMPAHLIAPVAELGRVSADILNQTHADRRLAWVSALCDTLTLEYPRPWGSKTPITTLLCSGSASIGDKADAAAAFLRKPPSGGHEAMAAMAILRALYQSADRLGFAGVTVPFISRANNDYVNNMLKLTGRIYVPWGAQKPKHQGVGLTAYGAPSPVDASWMQPGTISSHLYRPNFACSTVARDLAFGNPYGVGISGSANIFLYAADSFNGRGATHIDLMDMATSMAVMLCYNGGHSFNEVYSAAQMYPGAAQTTLAALNGYHPGQARGLFISQVDPTGSWLAEAACRRLAAFLIAQGE